MSDYVNSSSDHNYKFKLTLHPLSHSSVLIRFGFEWYVYLVMFIIVGVAITVEVLIYSFYHYITNRKEIKPSIKMWLYLKTFILNIVLGIIAGLIPIMLALILIKLISTGRIG